ncbi:MAG: cysteine synthase A [Calditrichales bacterium]|nr:MAG: cysteine synthase A [Calditrichales bacterium]
MIYKNILETIGRTPMVKINQLTNADEAEVVAKLEFFNPGGSVKDRVGYNLLIDAEQRGVLKKGDIIVEPTSGNTGVGLAMAAAVKGYETIFTMPESVSDERKALLKQYGATLILTPGEKGMNGAVARAEVLAGQAGYFMPQQFKNPANPEIHRKTTGPEIIESLGDRIPDYFVCGVGTGGTVTGVGQVLHEKYPNISVIAVEPAGSPVLSGGKPGPHKIQGIGAGFIPENYKHDVVNEIICVENEDAFETARQLARKEGIMAGISSGASMFAALQIARKAGKGKLVVVVLPDTGERYISTDLFKGSV